MFSKCVLLCITVADSIYLYFNFNQGKASKRNANLSLCVAGISTCTTEQEEA